MEQQFILRLPEKLQNHDPNDFRLVKKNSKEVKFYVKDKEYPGIICKIPTIIETQKCIDNKLYKIADLSTLIVIYEQSGFNVEQEIKRHELSGLTPPMGFVKERQFSSTNAIRAEEIEEIERKVAELLNEDAKAFKVEIVGTEKDSSEMDIDLFAAELENELPKSKEPQEYNMQDIVTDMDNAINTEELQKSHDKFATPEINTASSPTLEHKEKPYSSYIGSGMDEITNIGFTPNLEQPIMSVEPTVKTEENIMQSESIKNETISENPIQEKSPIVDPILLELEEKIKEKETLANKSVNPILKKRFEQAVKDLKVQYEKRKEELNN